MVSIDKVITAKNYTPVDLDELVSKVTLELSKNNIVPTDTHQLVRELGEVFTKCIRRNRARGVNYVKMLVFPAKTGTSKSLSTKVYISLLEEDASLIIVPTVADALEYCQQINYFRGDPEYARCYYSVSGDNPDNSLRVDKAKLLNHRCIVITHAMYRSVNISDTVESIRNYKDGYRDLVVVDERLDSSIRYTISNKEIENLIRWVDNINSRYRGKFTKELDQLNWLLNYINDKISECKMFKKTSLPCYESISDLSTHADLEFINIKEILTDTHSKISKEYSGSKSTDLTESNLKNNLLEQLDNIKAISKQKHTLYTSGDYAVLSVNQTIYSSIGTMVVLDATARINKKYEAHMNLTENELELFEPINPRVYDSLKIHKAKGYPQGRDSVFKAKDPKERKRYAKDYIEMIKTQITLTDKALIVTFKDFTGYLEDEINARDNIQITHYGNHVGKNKWSNCNKVFIIGWNYLPQSELLGSITSIVNNDLNLINQYDLLEAHQVLLRTSIADDLIQAAMRGTARRTNNINGDCPISDLYLFYPDNAEGSVVMNIVEKEFNGSKAVDWEPVLEHPSMTISKSSKNVDTIINYLKDQELKGEKIITTAQAISATEISKSAFNRTINLEPFDAQLHHCGYKYEKAPDGRGSGKAFYLE